MTTGTGARPEPGADRPADESGDVSALAMLSDLLRWWKPLVFVPLATAFVALAITFALPRRYTAVASFIPDTRSGTADLLPAMVGGGLAGQLLSGLAGNASQSPRFYAEVLLSRTIMEGVLLTPYSEGPGPEGTTFLTALFDVSGRTHVDSLAEGVRRLRKIVGTSVDVATNVVEVHATAATPALAAAIPNRLIELLNQFNSHRRQSRAGERRRFIDGRLEASAAELKVAQDAARRFLESNRSYESSPQLRFAFDELQRQLDAAQEVYVTLLREHERASIEEVNDTPVVTVIDGAVPPRRKSHPRRALILLVSGGIAAVGVAMVVLLLDQVAGARQREDSDYRGLLASWAQLRREVRSWAGRPDKLGHGGAP